MRLQNILNFRPDDEEYRTFIEVSEKSLTKDELLDMIDIDYLQGLMEEAHKEYCEDNGICPECGARLDNYDMEVPYGNTGARMPVIECPMGH